MDKCVICHTNVPVIFTTRFENGETKSEGLCLSCAYHRKIPGMSAMMERSGINADNVDEITERINTVMEQMEDSNPEELFNMMTGGNGGFMNQFPGFPVISDKDDDQLDISDEDFFASFDEDDQAFDQDDDSGNKEFNPLKMFSFSSKGKDSEEPDTDVETDDTDGTMKDIPTWTKEAFERRSEKKKKNKKRKFLDQFGRNLNLMAQDDGLDPLIGREKEVGRVIQILNRRSKNNPVLLGEPGVGKTAIAEGLASRIVAGDVPAKLLEMEVYLLDMTGMVAGTQFRGQFESRMKGVVEEASKLGNIILVIDELHNIMGAGDAEGAMNAANILKPALARGEIRVLGSTTLEEYRRFVEKDSALERRFQQVKVDPPTEAESLDILKGLRDRFQAHHHCIYSDEVLEACVSLSERYLHERFLPDKAIDLMDEAGSHANLQDERLVAHRKLKEELNQLAARQQHMESAKIPEKPDVQEAYFKEQADLKSEILRKEEALHEIELNLKPTEITVEDIASVVEMWTGVPVKQMTETEQQKLLHLEDRLHERVIGQDKAVNAVSRAVRRSLSGLKDRHKPSSFIFVGPTGVGKTELVKALAETLFGREDALIRLDMSEFMEPHTVSKLIGSPPGYVGYDDGGQLTEQVRRQPYSVILFDEIEKAHSDVFNMLLQILDDGRLTDSHGKTVSFENTVIVMTSNAGTTLKSQGFGFGQSGYEALESRVRSVLEDMFRPEFLNRLDEIIVFSELTPEELRRIIDLMLQRIQSELKRKQLTLDVTDEAKDQLAKEGYDARYGARPLRRTLQRYIEDPLAELYLEGKLDGLTKIHVTHLSDAELGEHLTEISNGLHIYGIK